MDMADVLEMAKATDMWSLRYLKVGPRDEVVTMSDISLVV